MLGRYGREKFLLPLPAHREEQDIYIPGACNALQSPGFRQVKLRGKDC